MDGARLQFDPKLIGMAIVGLVNSPLKVRRTLATHNTIVFSLANSGNTFSPAAFLGMHISNADNTDTMIINTDDSAKCIPGHSLIKL
jgi:hypothetical protein